ncbi:MAG: hypothetical protein K6E94_05795 [Elusimicrobiaceae bacterium]|nr:hypothetical protein [Elusimicrobiaceae bacterium]
MKNLLKNHKYILLFCLFCFAACSSAQKNTVSKSNLYNAKGEMYLKIADYKKADKYLNLAIAENSYNLDAYKNRATLYYTLGDFEKALQDFDYVLSYEQSDSTLAAKGALLATMGKYDESYKILYETLKINPSNVSALNSIAGLIYLQGDFEKAKDIYTISLKYRTSPEVYLMRSNCYKQLGEQDKADADYAMYILLKQGTGNTAPSK